MEKKQIIEVIAPSYGVESVYKSKELLHKLGYTPRFPENMIMEGADLFCANTDELRAKYLIDALMAADSQIIWAISGGYGASRLIPYLEKHDFSKHKKIILGFSDITTLHAYFVQKYGWKTIHCRNLHRISEAQNAGELEQVASILRQDLKSLSYDLKPLNAFAKNSDLCIKSTMIGGNLCLLQNSIGTTWQLETRGKILFLEDVDEAGYRIDRTLEHFMQSAILKGVKAIIFGTFTFQEKPEEEVLCMKAIQRFADQMSDTPVLYSDRFGHGKHNDPLVFGVETSLTLGNAPELTFEDLNVYEN